MNQSVSIIVPTLNEEKALPALLRNLEQLDPAPQEVLFVDGPSKDATASLIRQHGHKLIRSIAKGRSLQMNEGAFQASGDHLVFLHADTIVPLNLVEIVNSTLENAAVSLAGFTSVFRGISRHGSSLTLISGLKTYIGAFFYHPIRCLCFGFRLLFGDQVMFCRKADFVNVGGFNTDLPILEDADLCRRLNRLGSIRQLKDRVYASGRSVAAIGLMASYLRYFRIYLLYRLGASSKWLQSQYENIR
jgi:rSAM/selenodomain-associated transferase 2